MSDLTYAYYPAFKRRPDLPDPGEAGIRGWTRELEELFAKHDDRITVRGAYAASGFRPDVDVLFWWTAPAPDDHQDLLVELRRTSLGKHLELTHAFMGVTRPAEFNPDHLPAFLRGEDPRRYLVVYPFVRTIDWYLLPSEERSKLLREHGTMGREFPEVLPNTTSGFGLGDWEWILAFEADELDRIVDCLRRLREAEARRYTKLDVPFVIGIRKELAPLVAGLI